LMPLLVRSAGRHATTVHCVDHRRGRLRKMLDLMWLMMERRKSITYILKFKCCQWTPCLSWCTVTKYSFLATKCDGWRAADKKYRVFDPPIQPGCQVSLPIIPPTHGHLSFHESRVLYFRQEATPALPSTLSRSLRPYFSFSIINLHALRAVTA
jgi:hypothetical protein